MVNQVEFSPFLYQKELLEFCQSKNIRLEAYAPLTRGSQFKNPVLKTISLKYHKTVDQILIRWGLQHEIIEIPKSSDKQHLKENAKGSAAFVIEGKVTNHHKSPCNSIQVKGTLFDERGNPSVEGVVYCGNILTTKQIKSYPRKKIEKMLQNTYGETLSNFNIEPGKSVPFMLIFFYPPGKLSEFSVEVHQYTLQESATP